MNTSQICVLDNRLENILDWMNVSYMRLQTTYKEPLANVTIALKSLGMSNFIFSKYETKMK
jgi:hypothetical protein